MTDHQIDNSEDINLKKPPLEIIKPPEQTDYLKGQIIPSSKIFFNLECKLWIDFLDLLEPIHRFDIAGKSPTMPISIDISYEEEYATFTALAGLAYPTLLSFHRRHFKPETLDDQIKFLKECGYVIVRGKLSFANKRGE